MFVVFTKAPAPDAPEWPGRRWLAAADALVWPAVCFHLLAHLRPVGGLVVIVAMALTAMCAATRLVTALVRNHRYRFTTWILARPLLWLGGFGLLLKLLV